MEGNTMNVIGVKEELQITDCCGNYSESRIQVAGVFYLDNVDDDAASSSGTPPKRLKRDVKPELEKIPSNTNIPEDDILMSSYVIQVKKENAEELCDIPHTQHYHEHCVDPLADVPDHPMLTAAWPLETETTAEGDVSTKETATVKYIVNIGELIEGENAHKAVPVAEPLTEREAGVSGARSFQVYNHGGYMYYQYHLSDNVVNLKCIRIGSPGRCRGQATMRRYLKDTLRVVRAHNHAPDEVFGQRHHFMTYVMDRCSSELTGYSLIYREVAKEFPPDVSASATYASLLPMMHQSRAIGLPETPGNLFELGNTLSSRQRNYPRLLLASDGTPFYHGTAGSGREEGRSSVFVSNALARSLASLEDLQMDGSFRVVPSFPAVGHLFTISAIRAGHAFPFVYVLMEQRNTKAYVAVLKYMKKMLPLMQPKRVVCDFDASLQEAIQLCFPSTEIYGCWFNFAEAICRKARAMFSRKQLQKHPQRRNLLKMILVLPFLPAGSTERGYKSIVEFAYKTKVLRLMCTFLDRFRTTWLEGIGPRHMSVYGAPFRASRAKENYCRKMVEHFTAEHIPIWRFLGRLQELEMKYAEHFAELDAVSVPDKGLRYVVPSTILEALAGAGPEVSSEDVSRSLESASNHLDPVYFRYAELLPDPECEEEFPEPSASCLTILQESSVQEENCKQSTTQQNAVQSHPKPNPTVHKEDDHSFKQLLSPRFPGVRCRTRIITQHGNVDHVRTSRPCIYKPHSTLAEKQSSKEMIPDRKGKCTDKGIRYHLSPRPSSRLPLPVNLLDLGRIIEGERICRRYANTLDGKAFFRCVTGSSLKNEGYSAVFISPTASELVESQELHMNTALDDALPSLPAMSHVFAITCVRGKEAFPLVTVLMERRTHKAYRSVLDYLKTVLPTMQPQRIITDYEKCLQDVLRECFPQAKLFGCWFSFASMMCRKLISLHVKNTSEAWETHKHVIKLSLALPLLPHDAIDLYYRYIDSKPKDKKTEAFLNYLYSSWLKGVGVNYLSISQQESRRSDAKYEYYASLLDEKRSQHDSIWTLLELVIKREKEKTNTLMQLKKAGSLQSQQSTTSKLEWPAMSDSSATENAYSFVALAETHVPLQLIRKLTSSIRKTVGKNLPEPASACLSPTPVGLGHAVASNHAKRVKTWLHESGSSSREPDSLLSQESDVAHSTEHVSNQNSDVTHAIVHVSSQVSNMAHSDCSTKQQLSQVSNVALTDSPTEHMLREVSNVTHSDHSTKQQLGQISNVAHSDHSTEQQSSQVINVAHSIKQQSSQISNMAHSDCSSEQQSSQVSNVAHSDHPTEQQVINVAHSIKQQSSQISNTAHSDRSSEQQSIQVSNVAHSDLSNEQQSNQVSNVAHSDRTNEQQSMSQVSNMANADRSTEQQSSQVSNVACSDRFTEQQSSEVSNVAHSEGSTERQSNQVANVDHSDCSMKQKSSQISNIAHSDRSSEQQSSHISNMAHSDRSSEQQSIQVSNVAHSDLSNEQQSNQVSNVAHSDRTNEQQSMSQVSNMANADRSTEQQSSQVSNVACSDRFTEQQSSEVSNVAHSEGSTERQSNQVANVDHSDCSIKQKSSQISNIAHSDRSSEQQSSHISNMAHSDRSSEQQSIQVSNVAHSDLSNEQQSMSLVSNMANADRSFEQQLSQVSNVDRSIEQQSSEVPNVAHSEGSNEQQSNQVANVDHSDRSIEQQSSEVPNVAHSEGSNEQQSNQVSNVAHSDHSIEQQSSEVPNVAHSEGSNEQQSNQVSNVAHSDHSNEQLSGEVPNVAHSEGSNEQQSNQVSNVARSDRSIEQLSVEVPKVAHSEGSNEQQSNQVSNVAHSDHSNEQQSNQVSNVDHSDCPIKQESSQISNIAHSDHSNEQQSMSQVSNIAHADGSTEQQSNQDSDTAHSNHSVEQVTNQTSVEAHPHLVMECDSSQDCDGARSNSSIEHVSNVVPDVAPTDRSDERISSKISDHSIEHVLNRGTTLHIDEQIVPNNAGSGSETIGTMMLIDNHPIGQLQENIGDQLGQQLNFDYDQLGQQHDYSDYQLSQQHGDGSFQGLFCGLFGIQPPGLSLASKVGNCKPRGRFCSIRNQKHEHYYGGYSYRVKKSTNCKNSYLVCCLKSCRATAILRDKDPHSLVITRHHNHGPDEFLMERIDLKKSLIARCTSELTDVKVILQEEIAKYPPEVSAGLTYEKLRSWIFRARTLKNASEPVDLNKLETAISGSGSETVGTMILKNNHSIGQQQENNDDLPGQQMDNDVHRPEQQHSGDGQLRQQHVNSSLRGLFCGLFGIQSAGHSLATKIGHCKSRRRFCSIRDRKREHYYDGYSYRVKKSTNCKTSYLVCCLRSCRATAILRDKDPHALVITRHHNHGPDEFLKERINLKKSLIARCTSELIDIKVILQEEIAKYPPEVSSGLTYDKLRSWIFRARTLKTPGEPADLNELGAIVQDGQYSHRYQSSGGVPFLRAIVGDGSEDEGRSVVFMSPVLAGALSSSPELHINGSPKMMPAKPPLAQLLVIIAVHCNIAFPLVYVLMERRTMQSYSRVLEYLKTELPSLQPSEIITDYDAPLLEAIHVCFPKAAVYGCWFSLADLVCSKCWSLGLSSTVLKCKTKAQAVKLCLTLPLLPHAHMAEGFSAVANAYGADKETRLFLDHFKVTWLERVGGRHLSVYNKPSRMSLPKENFWKSVLDYKHKIDQSVWLFLSHIMAEDKKSTKKFSTLNATTVLVKNRASVSLKPDQLDSLLSANETNVLPVLTQLCAAVESAWYMNMIVFPRSDDGAHVPTTGHLLSESADAPDVDDDGLSSDMTKFFAEVSLMSEPPDAASSVGLPEANDNTGSSSLPSNDGNEDSEDSSSKSLRSSRKSEETNCQPSLSEPLSGSTRSNAKDSIPLSQQQNHLPDSPQDHKETLKTALSAQRAVETSRRANNEEAARFPPEVAAAAVTQDEPSGVGCNFWASKQPSTPTSLRECGDLIARSVSHRGYALTADGAHFFRGVAGDGGEEEGCSLVFVSPTFAHALVSSAELLIDSCSQTVFSQPLVKTYLTISAIGHNTTFPLVNVLMERDTTKAYVSVLNHVKMLLPKMQPKTFICGYDCMIQGALKLCFPSANILGYWYSFVRLICAKANLELRPNFRFATHQSMRTAVDMCLVLPLLPHGFILEGYESILDFVAKKNIATKMQPFLTYFRKAWLEDVGPQRLSLYNHPSRRLSHNEIYQKDGQNIKHGNIWTFISDFVQTVERKKREDLARLRDSITPANGENATLDKQLDSALRWLAGGGYTLPEFLNVCAGYVDPLFSRYSQSLVPYDGEGVPEPVATSALTHTTSLPVTPAQAASCIALTNSLSVTPIQAASVPAHTTSLLVTPMQTASVLTRTTSQLIASTQAASALANTPSQPVKPIQAASALTRTTSQPITPTQAASALANTPSQPVKPIQAVSALTRTTSQPITPTQAASALANTPSQPVAPIQAASVLTRTTSQPVTPTQAESALAYTPSQPVTPIQAASVLTRTTSQPVTPTQAASALANTPSQPVMPIQTASALTRSRSKSDSKLGMLLTQSATPKTRNSTSSQKPVTQHDQTTKKTPRNKRCPTRVADAMVLQEVKQEMNAPNPPPNKTAVERGSRLPTANHRPHTVRSPNVKQERNDSDPLPRESAIKEEQLVPDRACNDRPGSSRVNDTQSLGSHINVAPNVDCSFSTPATNNNANTLMNSACNYPVLTVSTTDMVAQPGFSFQAPAGINSTSMAHSLSTSPTIANANTAQSQGYSMSCITSNSIGALPSQMYSFSAQATTWSTNMLPNPQFSFPVPQSGNDLNVLPNLGTVCSPSLANSGAFVLTNTSYVISTPVANSASVPQEPYGYLPVQPLVPTAHSSNGLTSNSGVCFSPVGSDNINMSQVSVYSSANVGLGMVSPNAVPVGNVPVSMGPLVMVPPSAGFNVTTPYYLVGP